MATFSPSCLCALHHKLERRRNASSILLAQTSSSYYQASRTPTFASRAYVETTALAPGALPGSVMGGTRYPAEAVGASRPPPTVNRFRRSQIEREFLQYIMQFIFRDMPQEKSHQVFLPCLPEHHPVNS